MSHDFYKNYELIYQQTEGDSFKINTQTLEGIILSFLEKTSPIRHIEIEQYDGFSHNGLYGMVTVNGDTAIIVVNGKQNECWKRFTVCKELLQLYIDYSNITSFYNSEEEIINQINELVELLAKSFSSGSFNVNAIFSDGQDIAELQAIIMAIDLIYPTTLMLEKIEKWDQDLKSKSIKHYDIAVELRMPEFMVKAYFETFYAISKQIFNGTSNILDSAK